MSSSTVRLVYASRSLGNATLSELTDMLARARERNAEHGVTGVLAFDSRYFLQLLEGERSAVNATYNRITQDPRHGDITLLVYEQGVERLFAEWSMGWVKRVDEPFEPFDLAPDRVVPLLQTFEL